MYELKTKETDSSVIEFIENVDLKKRGLGVFVQLVFRLFSFETTAIQHENLGQTFKA